MQELFLDANAHVPPSKETMLYFSKIASSLHGHPLSLTKAGRSAALLLEESRQKIAELIGAKSGSQIIFTLGCTQGCEWAFEIIKHLIDKEVELINPEKCSNIEHPAIRDPYKKYLQKKYLPSDHSTFYYDNINQLTKEHYITCVHLQNETGTIQPIKEIKNKCKFIFSDMSQSLGKIPVNVTDLDVDLAVFGAHKFSGINGVGFLYLKDYKYWTPFGTGSRYFTDRTGTPDVAGIAASAFALEAAISTLSERQQKSQEFQTIIESGLKNRGWEIICENLERSPNTSFVRKQGRGIHKLLSLNENAIYCGLGSACGSNSAGISPTLTSLGYTGHPHDFMRISQWGNYGKTEANYFLEQFDKE